MSQQQPFSPSVPHSLTPEYPYQAYGLPGEVCWTGYCPGTNLEYIITLRRDDRREPYLDGHDRKSRAAGQEIFALYEITHAVDQDYITECGTFLDFQQAVNTARRVGSSVNGSRAGSSFLDLAEVLSCVGAVVLGLIWFVAVLFFYIPLHNDPEPGTNDPVLAGIAIITMFCAFIEIPLLTVWGVCADRKHKKAQNRNDSKSDSWFLNLAKALSFGCLAVIAIFSLETLLPRFCNISHSTLKAIELNTAPFMLLITYCAFIAVPVLFIRNIYTHIKWKKDQNRK